ncbi:uncharacterized protein LOC133284390 [Gastrolobium bilobum]|uniref:uncharacterized protein LOC133284390 n=1 Tax=Gastrolobium bilobum TaxID=150636 RepID=UPI002AB102A2|nr:uncharacterized protein LOC133284390 [Gastrolobium bilobum]
MERYNQRVNDITNFTQIEGETLCMTWNRFKDLMRKFSHYNLIAGDQVRIFFNGSTPEDRMVLNGAAGGTIKTMRANETFELIKRMARNENQGLSSKSKKGSLQLGDNDSLLAENKLLCQQVASLSSRLDKMQIAGIQAKSVAFVCDYCQDNHEPNECPTLTSSDSPQQMQVNGIWYDQRPQQPTFQRNQNFSGGGGSNFQRRSQGAGMDFKPNNYAQPSQSQQREPAEWEKAFAQMAKTFNEIAQTTNAFMEETRAQNKNTNASIKNLENQVGQLAKKVSERIPGTFPSNTVTNPRGDCMSIITRSGKVVASPKNPNIECEGDEEKHDATVEAEKEVEIPVETVKPAEKENVKAKEQHVVVEKKHELSPEYVRAMAPYPERFKKDAQNKQYGRFLDIFKDLHINIPFAEALASMPNYAKFMKDLLSRKHKLQECQTVTLTEKCSAFIQQKIPPKLSDPGSFNIPIAIGNIGIGRALCDLGESINLMPLCLQIFGDQGIEVYGGLSPTC